MEGLFTFNDLMCVGKRATSFDGVDYFYITLSNGEKVVEFSVNKAAYDSTSAFKKYSGSFDFANKKLKLVTLVPGK